MYFNQIYGWLMDLHRITSLPLSYVVFFQGSTQGVFPLEKSCRPLCFLDPHPLVSLNSFLLIIPHQNENVRSSRNSDINLSSDYLFSKIVIQQYLEVFTFLRQLLCGLSDRFRVFDFSSKKRACTPHRAFEQLVCYSSKLSFLKLSEQTNNYITIFC